MVIPMAMATTSTKTTIKDLSSRPRDDFRIPYNDCVTTRSGATASPATMGWLGFWDMGSFSRRERAHYVIYAEKR